MRNVSRTITATAFLLCAIASTSALSASDKYEIPADVKSNVDAMKSQMQTSKNCAGVTVYIQCGNTHEACDQISTIAKQALRPISAVAGFSVPPLSNYLAEMKMWENGGRRGGRPKPPGSTYVYASKSARAACANEIAGVISAILPSLVEHEIQPALQYYERWALPKAVVPVQAGVMGNENKHDFIQIDWHQNGN